MKKSRPWLVWAALLVMGAVFEHRALRRPEANSTLSAVVRSTFRTETRMGRLAFMFSWFGLTAWFVPHIIRQKRVLPCLDTSLA